MDSLKKAVIVITVIGALIAVGLVILPSTDLGLLDRNSTEQTGQQMPNQYSKSINISVNRQLSNQPDVSEDISIQSVINREEQVSRLHINETFEREGTVLDSTSKVRYIDGSENKTYKFPDMIVENQSLMPVVNNSKLSNFQRSEQSNIITLSSNKTSLVGFTGFNVQRYITSNEFNSVKYRVQINAQTNRLRSYRIIAESESEVVSIDGNYNYNQPTIFTTETTRDNRSVNYTTNMQSIIVRSQTSDRQSTIGSQAGSISLVKGEDISDYEEFEIVRVTDNDGREYQEHLITDQKVIISEINP